MVLAWEALCENFHLGPSDHICDARHAGQTVINLQVVASPADLSGALVEAGMHSNDAL